MRSALKLQLFDVVPTHLVHHPGFQRAISRRQSHLPFPSESVPTSGPLPEGEPTRTCTCTCKWKELITTTSLEPTVRGWRQAHEAASRDTLTRMSHTLTSPPPNRCPPEQACGATWQCRSGFQACGPLDGAAHTHTHRTWLGCCGPIWLGEGRLVAPAACPLSGAPPAPHSGPRGAQPESHVKEGLNPSNTGDASLPCGPVAVPAAAPGSHLARPPSRAAAPPACPLPSLRDGPAPLPGMGHLLASTGPECAAQGGARLTGSLVGPGVGSPGLHYCQKTA